MIKEATTRQHVAIINCRFRADNKLLQPATTAVRFDREEARNRQLIIAHTLQASVKRLRNQTDTFALLTKPYSNTE